MLCVKLQPLLWICARCWQPSMALCVGPVTGLTEHNARTCRRNRSPGSRHLTAPTCRDYLTARNRQLSVNSRTADGKHRGCRRPLIIKAGPSTSTFPSTGHPRAGRRPERASVPLRPHFPSEPIAQRADNESGGDNAGKVEYAGALVAHLRLLQSRSSIWLDLSHQHQCFAL